MLARWMTLVVWALAAACALFWGLKLAARPAPVPAQALLASAGTGARGDLTRLLGADAAPVAAAPAEPAADARFSLLGVVTPRAPRAANEGVALIVVDGKPARAYRVGAAVGDSHVLNAVSARGATLGVRNGGADIALNVAPQAAAATGTLPVAGAGAGAGAGAAAEPEPSTPAARVAAARAARQAVQRPPPEPGATGAGGDPAVR